MGMNWFSSLTLGIALATLPALAQPPAPAPTPDQPSTGWRAFEGSQPPAEAADQAPQPMPSGPPMPATLTLPAGTLLTVRVNQPLSSDHNQKDDAFTASLAQPIINEGLVVARRGK